MIRRVFLILILVLPVIVACSDDPSGPDPEPEAQFGLPNDPATLVEAFLMALEQEHSVALDIMVHPDFRLVILDHTLQEWANAGEPMESAFFGSAGFLEINENIFAGNPGVGPQGFPVGGVEAIEVWDSQILGPWTEVEPSTPHFGDFEGARVARLAILMGFSLGNSNFMEVDGLMDMYVLHQDEGWALLGIEPIPLGAKAIESYSYCSVLSLYR